MKMKTSAFFISIIFFITIFASASFMLQASGSQTSMWVHFNITPTSAVYYDYDNDGIDETVLPSAIIKGYSLIPSPYPPLPYVAKADLLGTRINYLIMYGNGTLHIYDGLREVQNFTVPNVEPIITPNAFAFGNTIVWSNKTYTIKGNFTNIIPVADTNHLYATYYRDGYLRLLNVVTGNEISIYGNLLPLYGALEGNYAYIVATTQNDSLAVIKYEIGNSSEIGIYAVDPSTVFGFSPIAEAFYVKADNRLYLASPEYLLLLSDWEPISSDSEYIYLYKENTVAVFDISTENIVAILQLPINEKPSFVIGYPKPIVVFPDNGTYILYMGAPISITFYGSSSAMAGTLYQFNVSIAPSGTHYSIKVDGLPISPSNTTIVFKKVGYHNITVYATGGIITIEKTFSVYIYPRTLNVTLEVINPPMANTPIIINVRTLDGNTPVVLPCSVTLPSGDVVNGTTNDNITIPIGVPESSYYAITVSITGDMYGNIQIPYKIPVVPIPVKPTISFLGNGTFQIDMMSSIGNTLVNGTIKIYNESGLIYSGTTPGVIHFGNAGNYTLTVSFYPNNQYAFKTESMNIYITYLGEQETIPDTNGTQVLAVDHIINETKTVILNHTITEKVTGSVPKPTLDTRAAIIFFAVGMGAGIITAVSSLKRKKEGTNEERNEKDKELFIES